MEGKNKSSDPNLGRILDYEEAQPDELLVDFKRRVNEQISSIRIGIKNEDINDPEIAESYAKKAENFLQIPFLMDKKNKGKRVHHLKTHCKVIVMRDKEIIDALKDWIAQKRDFKISIAEQYSSPTARKEFDFIPAIKRFYDQDNNFLEGLRVKYDSERILLRKLIHMLSDNVFIKSLGIKNSWKVSNLKRQLSDWAEDYNFDVENELEDIFTLPYFKKKKYLDMTVKELLETVEVRLEVLDHMIDVWIENMKKSLNNVWSIGYGYGDKSQFSNYTVRDLLTYYDDAIRSRTLSLSFIQKEYSLYRFGQGLIEADIFDTLYK